jgi:phenylacetate-CoA ligase
MLAFLRRQAINLYQLANGRRFLTRMMELDRTQWLNREELLALQQQKLHRLLEYAHNNVPYYRRLFDQVGFQPDDILKDPASFHKIPFLTKPVIRENFDDLLTTDAKRRSRMTQLSTAGSTGQPLVFMQDISFRDQVTAELHHHLTWTGWEFGQPHAYIFGASFEVSYARNLRVRFMNLLLNRFVTNAYRLSEESMHAFAATAVRRRPRLLFGYASSLYRFAQFICNNPSYDLKFVGAVFTTSEVLYPAQRQLIEDTFGCKVFNRYATRELGALACECGAHTGLHISVENAYVEILNDGAPTEPDEPGDIFVTNLNNYGMPFIRYQLADVAAWHPDEHCPCGRAHPMMKVVEGRHNDMFKRRDGGAVWGGIGNPLWNMEGVRKFQFIQKTYDYVVVKVASDGPFTQVQQAEVEKAVNTALGGGVKVDFEFPDEIPVGRSGKHLYQICEVD